MPERISPSFLEFFPNFACEHPEAVRGLVFLDAMKVEFIDFGLEDSREMESWAPGLTFLDDWTYFDEDEPKLGWMRWLARWPLVRWAQWTVHYRLVTAR